MQGESEQFDSRPKIISDFGYTVHMIDIDRKLIRSFWSHKIAKKKDLETYFFLLKKVISIKRSICKHFCSVLTQYYKNDFLIEITFLSKKKYINF